MRGLMDGHQAAVSGHNRNKLGQFLIHSVIGIDYTTESLDFRFVRVFLSCIRWERKEVRLL